MVAYCRMSFSLGFYSVSIMQNLKGKSAITSDVSNNYNLTRRIHPRILRGNMHAHRQWRIRLTLFGMTCFLSAVRGCSRRFLEYVFLSFVS
jgi:hypothetical protein